MDGRRDPSPAPKGLDRTGVEALVPQGGGRRPQDQAPAASSSVLGTERLVLQVAVSRVKKVPVEHRETPVYAAAAG